NLYRHRAAGRGGRDQYSPDKRRIDGKAGRPPPPRRAAVERLAEERFSEQERLRLGALEQMRQAEQR
ncbi:lipase chaperone, partial [Pseudomonas aeruginosa]|nr:lipase chaperone [Pseudomonas aeruginosa]